MEFVIILVLILVFLTDYGQPALPPGEGNEEDMSPIIGLLMYDDFVEDGDLDIF